MSTRLIRVFLLAPSRVLNKTREVCLIQPGGVPRQMSDLEVLIETCHRSIDDSQIRQATTLNCSALNPLVLSIQPTSVPLTGFSDLRTCV